MQRLRRQFKRRPDVRVAARTQSRRAATRWNCYAEVAHAIQTKARRQSCRTHAIPTSRCSSELLCRGCAGNSNEGRTSELPHARNADEPLLAGIARQRLRRQFKRRPDARVAARTQPRRAATRWNCYAEVAQAIQTKARRQSRRTHAIPTSRYSLELLCKGCAGDSNEGRTSELPHARNADEPLLVGIAMQRLRRQFKRKPDVRVAARTQSRRAATRLNCFAEVAQAIQTKARRQSRRTHATPTSRCSLELLCRGCAGNSNEGRTSELPHARNADEPLLVGIALQGLRRQFKRRPDVRVAARTQSRRLLVGIAMQRLRMQFKRRPDVRVAARTQSRRAAARWNCYAEVAQAIQTKAGRQSCRTHAIPTSRYSLELLCRGCAGSSNEGQTSESPHARHPDEPLLVGIAMQRLRRQFKRRPDVRVAARTQSRRAATRWNCYAEVAQAVQAKARRQSCRTHAMPTSRCSLELLCRGCAGNSNEGQTSELLHARNPDVYLLELLCRGCACNSNEGQTSELPHARNPDEPLLVGIAMQRLRRQFKRRPDVRVAARTQSRRAATRWNCYAEVAQAVQTKARRQSRRTHAIPTSRCSLELLCRGCAGNSNEGRTSELPHARNADEPLLVGIAMQGLRRQFKRRPDVRVAARTQSRRLLVGIAMQRLRMQFKRRPDVRVAARTQSRRAAARWNCYAEVAQAIQTKAGRQSCRTHAIPTSRYSLELLCRGCAGSSNEGQTSESPHARNPDEPLLVGIAMQRLRRQFKRRPDVRVAARTQCRRAAARWNCYAEVAQAIQTKARRQSCRTHAIPTSRYSFELLCRGCAGNSSEGQASELSHARNADEPLLVGIAMQRLRRQFKRKPDVRVAARTQCRRAAARWNC